MPVPSRSRPVNEPCRSKAGPRSVMSPCRSQRKPPRAANSRNGSGAYPIPARADVAAELLSPTLLSSAYDRVDQRPSADHRVSQRHRPSQVQHLLRALEFPSGRSFELNDVRGVRPRDGPASRSRGGVDQQPSDPVVGVEMPVEEDGSPACPGGRVGREGKKVVSPLRSLAERKGSQTQEQDGHPGNGLQAMVRTDRPGLRAPEW